MFSQDKLKSVAWMLWMDNPQIAVPVEDTNRETRFCAHCCKETDKKVPLFVICTNITSERIQNEKANWTCCQTCLMLDVFTSGLCDNWVFIDERGVVYDKTRGIRGV
jgi:hypothetical protein